MSWITTDGRHEGHAAYIARDGRAALTITSEGLQVATPLIPFLEHDELLPWDELFGWEARCTCGWTGALWRADDDQHHPEEHATDDGTAEDHIEQQWVRHVEVEEAKWGRTPAFV